MPKKSTLIHGSRSSGFWRNSLAGETAGECRAIRGWDQLRNPHLVVSKYVDHTPLHRLEGIFARHGLEISRVTMCDWVGGVADALRPIVDWMKREITHADYPQTDDTPVKVLAYRKEGFKGRLWAYLDPLGGQVVFDATRTHERKGPEEFLSSFEVYLQADAYTGYDELYKSKRVVEVGCWAHGRRRFVESLGTDARAASVIALVQKLYQKEREFSELSAAELTQSRTEHSKPILDQLDELRQELERMVLPNLGGRGSFGWFIYGHTCRYFWRVPIP